MTLHNALCAAALSLTVLAASAEPAQQHRIMPLRAMTEDVEILHGDPDKAGEPFVMRIRELPGTIIPPHRHPIDEHITVVQGTLYFGVGDRFDRSAMREVKVGEYVFIPKGSTMFGYSPEGAIVQVHGTGPFHIHWRAGSEWLETHKTLDDANAAAVFKFRKGDRVIAGRGSGRVRQGYFSGEVLQYVIEGRAGRLFMANEEELRRR